MSVAQGDVRASHCIPKIEFLEMPHACIKLKPVNSVKRDVYCFPCKCAADHLG